MQSAVTRIANYVVSTYDGNQAALFLKKADPWVIAHAIAESGSVVTLESKVPANSKKAKIPNVCEHFDVQWSPMFEMLRELGLRL